ncbi:MULTISPECIES: enoyl-CoA hydratase-related protein [Nocardiaceae]|uniref:enoyl-CoA hydratase-related protein n=1 Tax=Nocardiaceae TaxID=85025 RepID=UPI00050C6E31|nr:MULTISPECIES: enoyl-CoA hydratase-related protein [Rhodococcus]OZD77213.1 enoyl-CoA hydratase [Rhodococcus sp. 05-2256-B4]OZD88332.1 enoyl-CoA hydratase [Rhodococcus sp. 05-2256-B3]OZD98465.1 enoyl-CoA hydratase [Rhodococcus sp. 05-2256-B2]OZE05328.1 enoyl-CoA hydratase [Rhodococcus sp. 05-2256-B1]
MPYLERTADVFVLNLGSRGVDDTENRISPNWVAEINTLLDEVQAGSGSAALVTTATGKYFSTGVDLSWGAENLDQINRFIGTVQEMLVRFLTLPMQTVAAMQGHTFGGAAFFAMAHDYRIMRSDRGFLCFPGVNIGATYSPGTVDMVRAKMAPNAFHEALTTGRRYGGDDAMALGLVHDVSAADSLLDTAVARAGELAGTRGDVLGEIKRTMYAPEIRSLLTPVAGVDEMEWASN